MNVRTQLHLGNDFVTGQPVLLQDNVLEIQHLIGETYKITTLPLECNNGKESTTVQYLRDNGVFTDAIDSTHSFIYIPITEESSEGITNICVPVSSSSSNIKSQEVIATAVSEYLQGINPVADSENKSSENNCSENLEVNDTNQPQEKFSCPAPFPEKQKRKGGWPKGRKRKRETIKPPRAPTTGYVIYLNERRQEVRRKSPGLSFAEVTKLIGNEWSNLPADVKQQYLDRAVEDKKRYKNELKAYRQSDVYQANLQLKRKQKELPSSSDQPLNPQLIIDDTEDESSMELYCNVCNQFFSSAHNKKEHLYGKQHRQALTEEMHKENYTDSSDDSLASNTEIKNYFQEPTGPTIVNNVILNLMKMCLVREDEIAVLKQKKESIKTTNCKLQKELSLLKETKRKTEQELKTLKAFGTSLSTQLDNLRMVPTLFGVVNF